MSNSVDFAGNPLKISKLRLKTDKSVEPTDMTYAVKHNQQYKTRI